MIKNLKVLFLKSLLLISFLLISSCQKENQSTSFANSNSSNIINGVLEENSFILENVFKMGMANYLGWGLCSSFKLKEGLILTASHCMYEHQQYKYSLARLSIDPPNSDKKIIYEMAFPDPYRLDFESNISFKDDLLALFVGTGFDFQNQGFELPEESEKLPKVLYASGFGQQEIDKPINSVELARSAKLKTVAIDTQKQRIFSFDINWILSSRCQEYSDKSKKESCLSNVIQYYKLAESAIESEHMLCFETINGGNSAANGDSGGPLYAPNSQGKLVVYGVFSWLTWGADKKNRYFCYTNVQKYLSWIKEKIAYQKFIRSNSLQVKINGQQTRLFENITAMPLKKFNKLIHTPLFVVPPEALYISLNIPEIKGKIVLDFSTRTTDTGIYNFFYRAGAAGVIMAGNTGLEQNSAQAYVNYPITFELDRPFFIRLISSLDGQEILDFIKSNNSTKASVSLSY